MTKVHVSNHLKDIYFMFWRYVDRDFIAANRGYVGLALPGAAGSWQRECKVRF